MGVKLPPIWRKREKATAKGDKKPQPPLFLVLVLRFLIEVSKQLIYTFAAVQIVLSFSVGRNIFGNRRLDLEYEQALGFCEGDRACERELQGPCPPGASNHAGGRTSHCADPSYMTPGLGFFEWLFLPSSGEYLLLISIFLTFFIVALVFTSLLMCGCGCSDSFPTATGESVAGSPDVAICCARPPHTAL